MINLVLNKNKKSNLIKFVCVGLLVLFSFAFFACKKKDNLDKIAKDLTNYTLEVNFDNDNKMVEAKQNVSYINNTESVLKEIKFHLYPKFFEQGATEKIVPQTKVNECYKHGMSYCEFNILKLQVAGTDIGVVFEGENDGVLVANLPNSLMPNKRVQLYMEYTIKLPNCEHRFGYGDDTTNLANFYPIACVFENGEFSTKPYNANGDPFYSDMANYEVNLTLNSNLIVAGTGKQTEISQRKGKTVTKFSAKVVRDFACVISENFALKTAKAGDVEVKYYYYDDGNSDRALQAGVDAINTFSSKFGAYPYSTFSIVKCDFLHGGMEFPNLVMISDDINSVDDYINVIIHETAHQWWYGVVGNDEFTLPWLDEALTEYSTVLFYDYNKGYNLTHDQIIKADKENFSLFVSVYEDVLGKVDTSMRAVDEYATEPEYTYCTYVKGSLMFESLYQLVGEKKFFKALVQYFENNKFKNAKTEDLVAAFSNITGSDMQSFFNSWIKGKVVIK